MIICFRTFMFEFEPNCSDFRKVLLMLVSLCKERLRKVLSPDSRSFYKVLILDESTKAILAPHLRLSDLRTHGVAALFMLHSRRDELTDIPAVYFVHPTPENIRRVAADIESRLYPWCFLSLASKTPRSLLEGLAAAAGSCSRGLCVRSFRDEFLSFVALSDSLFTLNRHSSYLCYDRSDSVTDAALGLVSVFCTLREAPFVVGCGNAAISLVDSLGGVLKSALDGCAADPHKKNLQNGDTRSVNEPSQYKPGFTHAKRPLLIVFDRSIDFISPFSHSWAYNSLLCDVLDLRLNRVSIKEKENQKAFTFDLESEDTFWANHSASDFQIASAAIENELLVHKKELAARCISDSAEHSKIAEALQNAPKLAARNEQLRGHMAACLQIIDSVKARSIDEFCRLETQRNVNDQEISEITAKGTQLDILRLGMKLIGKSNIESIQSMFVARNINPEILNLEIFNQNGSEAWKSSQGLLQTVRRLLPRSSEPALFNIVENIHSMIKGGRPLADFKTCDPISGRSSLYDCEINKIVVFIIGNGCYEEANSLSRLGKKLGINILYGCDDIVSSEEYARQISERHDVRLFNKEN